MKVFITGATGYIGFSVAKKFRSEGYAVSGLTRSNDKVDLLRQNEIVPIIGNIRIPNDYLTQIRESDIIIHAAADYEQNLSETDKNFVKLIINESKKSDKPRKFIYTSGTWIYGNTGKNKATEKNDYNPIKIVDWRPEVEKIILENPYIKSIIIRPGCVYGQRGDMTNDWFKEIENNDTLTIIGDGNNHWPMIHVEDLANAYLLAAERYINNTAFNIVEESSVSLNAIAINLKSAIKFNGIINYISNEDVIKDMGDYAEALAIDQRFDTTKAKQVLNWYPKHKGFHKDIGLYYSAWKANKHYK